MSIIENTYAIENNLFDFFRTVAQVSKRVLYADKNISWVNCAPSPWPCGIFETNLSAESAKENIALVKNQIKRGIAPKLWMTGPSVRPKRLGEQLLESGFVKKEDKTGMALNFSKLKSDFEQPQGLHVEIVTDSKNLQDWAGVVSSGLLGCEGKEASSFYELMTAVINCKKVTFFLGYYEDKPAASSTLFVSDDIAGIYHVATLPSFRKKGIGRSITTAPLLQAKEMGARFAVLQSSQSAINLFSRIGFTEYCKLDAYFLDA